MIPRVFPSKFLCGLLTSTLLLTAGQSLAGTIACDGDDEAELVVTSERLPDFEVTGPSSQYYNSHLRPYSVMEPVDVFELDMEATCGVPGFESNTSYRVKMSAKELMLKYPGDPNMATLAMWDNPYQRIADRNMPWIEVTNEAGSDGVMTQFMMTIGDEANNFSVLHFGGPIMESEDNSPGLGLSASVSEDGNKLTIDVTGGLDPGETMRFRIDIDPDNPDAFPHPDYRLVLFDMNGSSMEDNSAITLDTEFCGCIPEPGTLALLVISGLAIGGVIWRQRIAA